MPLNRLQERLQQREEEGTRRSLSLFSEHVDFWSNDYLGLARTAVQASFSGATGSRLLSGNSKEAETCEAFFG